MAKVTKEEFEQMRVEMKEVSRELVNENGSYGKMDRIYSFILLYDDSCAIVFSPQKDPKARIGALVIKKQLFMAGPTSCRMAGEYVVECFQELLAKVDSQPQEAEEEYNYDDSNEAEEASTTDNNE